MQTRSIQTYQGGPAAGSVQDREAPYLQLRPPLRIHGGLLVVTFVMVCFGLVMLFSASMSDSFNANSGNSMYYILKQGSITLIGLILALIMAVLIPVSFYDRPIITFATYLLTTGLLVYVKFFGSIVNGAKRWILIGPLSIQPSEFAKLAAVICLAGYFSRLRSRRQRGEIRYRSPVQRFLGDGWRDILIPGLMMAVWLGLVIWQPHVSGFVILSVVIFASFLAAGLPLRSWLSGILQLTMILVLVGALAFGVFAATLKDQTMQEALESNFSHAFKRIETFRNPEEASSDDSYQVNQSLIAIGSGGLTGVGLGNGRQKYNYLPEAHNDYIFAIIGEELGFIGTVSVIVLFLLFHLIGTRIAWRAINPHAAILAAGYTVLITTQALLNIGVATRSLPATGISLPFFSYGGTSNLFFMLAIGFILGVSRTGQMLTGRQRNLMGEINKIARGESR
ncbi:MAG: cell division protein FtsW [Clostridia bacterium]|nr:cell division protein FtsW [Clostridia bacterium]NCC75066.1 cell division protein FtsW [Clostridia bacterium]